MFRMAVVARMQMEIGFVSWISGTKNTCWYNNVVEEECDPVCLPHEEERCR